jgi:Domain of unknown function (DUF397)
MATRPNQDPTLVWRKSRASGADHGCLEVAVSKSSVLIRDSHDRVGTRLSFSPDQWRAFVSLVKGRVTLQD